MGTNFTLPNWHALATLEDVRLPLLATALLIASDEYPELEPAHYDTLVNRHVDHLWREIELIDAWPLKMQAINRHLFEELGYAGDHEQYYDPRNSYLNEVFERRLGNPISLALVQMEVSRRLGVPLDGVSFPGHFLVRLPVDDGVLVMDPFNRGRPLDADELRERVRPHLGGDVPDDEALNQILSPASNRGMLVRMLRNLHGVYASRADWQRATRSIDRILKLMPNNADAIRDRGLGYLELDYTNGARQDLTRYLRLRPDAHDAAALRKRLIELGGGRSLLH